jgi:hypothetical protein
MSGSAVLRVLADATSSMQHDIFDDQEKQHQTWAA